MPQLKPKSVLSAFAAFLIVAGLVFFGLPSATLELYGSASLTKYHLLRHALGSLDHDAEHGITWMAVPHDAFEELKATPDDLEGMVVLVFEFHQIF